MFKPQLVFVIPGLLTLQGIPFHRIFLFQYQIGWQVSQKFAHRGQLTNVRLQDGSIAGIVEEARVGARTPVKLSFGHDLGVKAVTSRSGCSRWLCRRGRNNSWCGDRSGC